MSGPADAGTAVNPVSLYDHAQRLHRLNLDAALPSEGEPYPDEDQHTDGRPRAPKDYRHSGMEAAAVLDAYFARADSQPSDLAWAFHGVHVPIHRNEHIAAAALKRRRGGTDALLWLADRVIEWGRVYVVEALCEVGGVAARPWLLRRACNGDYLNGYFAGKVATAAHVHEAIIAAGVDDEVTDHTGRLLRIMAGAEGMGATWRSYPPIGLVLDAQAGHLARQAPSLARYFDAALIADHLARASADTLGLTDGFRAQLLGRYLGVLRRPEWSEAARAGDDPAGKSHAQFASRVAARLGLPAFTGPATRPGGTRLGQATHGRAVTRRSAPGQAGSPGRDRRDA